MLGVPVNDPPVLANMDVIAFVAVVPVPDDGMRYDVAD